MLEWDLYVTYSVKPYTLKAKVVYESTQIMRIRVFGNTNSILLENDYPLIKLRNSKRGFRWKIKESNMNSGAVSANARLLKSIMQQLEYLVKKEFERRDRNLFSME